jgi:hypothetical protein
MSSRILRYSVGNEFNPANPWGRSELLMESDGTVRVEHHFSRVHTIGAWTGRVEAAAVDALWLALSQAGFPDAPTGPLAPGATLRQLTVEDGGTARVATVDWHKASTLPGYAEAFDILDAVVRQLSGDTVPYPTNQPAIVRDITPVPPATA